MAHHPNLYAVYLTNHGCGPDTMLSYLFRKEMGDKPYLQIEVDEHFSPVGVITRIEAFLQSLEAVSYTHLDVYKRQAHHAPRLDGDEFAQSRRLLNRQIAENVHFRASFRVLKVSISPFLVGRHCRGNQTGYNQ